MKIENTLENKARFFALYWGQKVAMYKTDQSIKLRIGNPVVDIEHIDSLELTSISQISDKDAIEVAKIVVPFTGLSGWWEPEHGRRWANQIMEGIAVPNARSVVDFLRSRGYYVGDGTEIEYGWVKLKGEKS